LRTRTNYTDPIARVTDVNSDLEHNQPSGVEYIEMHVNLTSKYGGRVLLAKYEDILLVISILDKEIRS